MHLAIFGFGFTGKALARRLAPRGWTLGVSVRRPEGRLAAEAQGAAPFDPADPDEVAAALAGADALLVAAPPGPDGCPGLAALGPALAVQPNRPTWIGYLSTTGVYGDRGGRWVFESGALHARSVEGARRVRAEQDWLRFGAEAGLAVTVFRLPGIYGPGRAPFGRLRDGTARRLVKPGHVFSRIHVDDLAAGLHASMARPRAGGVYNLCDDEPAPASAVTAYAAQLLGLEPPPETLYRAETVSPALARFYAESKRVSNALAKAELGWRPAYPTYREGLGAVLASEASSH